MHTTRAHHRTGLCGRGTVHTSGLKETAEKPIIKRKGMGSITYLDD